MRTLRKLYCGAPVVDFSADENAQGLVHHKRNDSGGVVTDTELGEFLPDGTPARITTRSTAGNVLRYTQTKQVIFAEHSAVPVGTVLTNDVPADALFDAVTETQRRVWRQRGYAPPSPLP